MWSCYKTHSSCEVLLYLHNCHLARYCLVELANDALALGAPEKLQEMYVLVKCGDSIFSVCVHQ